MVRPLYKKSRDLVSSLSDSEIRQGAYKNTLGANTMETLVQELNRLTNPDKTRKEEMIEKFRALGALSDTSCARIGSLLQNVGYETVSWQILTTALSRIQTPAATNAIAALISYRTQGRQESPGMSEENAVVDLLQMLATTASPTDQAVNVAGLLARRSGKTPAIRSGSTQAISFTAQLALGGMAYHYRKIDRTKAALITRQLLEDCRHSTDTIQNLLVLGNTGSGAIIPVIRACLMNKHISAEIGVAAIEALRLIQTGEAEALLRHIAAGNNKAYRSKADRSKAYRSAASETILFRKQFFAD